MPTSTVENYLKGIYLAQSPENQDPVSMGDIAKALEVVPGTATTMIKHLAAKGYLDYFPRRGVRLTPEGERLALGVLRRHRLIEYFLVDTLGLPWDAIHEEAERIEHAISERVLDALDRFLGHPSSDPHGDPIPTAQGEVDSATHLPLSQIREGTNTVITRITDQEADFLQFAAEYGLRPGTKILVRSHSNAADAITIRVEGKNKDISLSLSAAEKILGAG